MRHASPHSAHSLEPKRLTSAAVTEHNWLKGDTLDISKLIASVFYYMQVFELYLKLHEATAMFTM